MAMSPRLLRPLASGFDPRRIAGLALWLDASDLSTLFDATTGGSLVAADAQVGRWEDKSGNGRHATQGTANNRPTLRDASLNGRSGLEFDGDDDSLATASFAHSVPLSIWLVHRLPTTSQTEFSRFFEHGANNGIAVTTSGGTYRAQYAISTSFNTGSALTTNANLVRVTVTSDATRTIAFSLNGEAEATFTRTQTPATPTAFHISQFGGGSFFSEQSVYEIVYYNRVLSASESSAVQKYLRRKWNVY